MAAVEKAIFVVAVVVVDGFFFRRYETPLGHDLLRSEPTASAVGPVVDPEGDPRTRPARRPSRRCPPIRSSPSAFRRSACPEKPPKIDRIFPKWIGSSQNRLDLPKIDRIGAVRRLATSCRRIPDGMTDDPAY